MKNQFRDEQPMSLLLLEASKVAKGVGWLVSDNGSQPPINGKGANRSERQNRLALLVEPKRSSARSFESSFQTSRAG